MADTIMPQPKELPQSSHFFHQDRVRDGILLTLAVVVGVIGVWSFWDGWKNDVQGLELMGFLLGFMSLCWTGAVLFGSSGHAIHLYKDHFEFMPNRWDRERIDKSKIKDLSVFDSKGKGRHAYLVETRDRSIWIPSTVGDLDMLVIGLQEISGLSVHQRELEKLPPMVQKLGFVGQAGMLFLLVHNTRQLFSHAPSHDLMSDLLDIPWLLLIFGSLGAIRLYYKNKQRRAS